MDRADIGPIERAVADLIAGTAGEQAQGKKRQHEERGGWSVECGLEAEPGPGTEYRVLSTLTLISIPTRASRTPHFALRVRLWLHRCFVPVGCAAIWAACSASAFFVASKSGFTLSLSGKRATIQGSCWAGLGGRPAIWPIRDSAFWASGVSVKSRTTWS